ncbi:MAG: hypothetical protein LC772_05810, partial [Chloroflexi bacterium]|nr:hypothetical protein [Chloroflexota bacterium]
GAGAVQPIHECPAALSCVNLNQIRHRYFAPLPGNHFDGAKAPAASRRPSDAGLCRAYSFAVPRLTSIGSRSNQISRIKGEAPCLRVRERRQIADKCVVRRV